MAAKRRDAGVFALCRIGAAVLFILTVVFATRAWPAEPMRIFAAASTIAAVNEAVIQFNSRTGIAAAAVFASSGALARQLAAGAPGHVFLSANERWMCWFWKRPGGRRREIVAAHKSASPACWLSILGTPKGGASGKK